MKVYRRFALNERLVVTGDKAEIDHDFVDGTEVTVDEFHEGWPTWYHCHDDNGASWWVDEQDLRRIAPDPADPTEDEILQLFGLKPRPHCTTCTCTED